MYTATFTFMKGAYDEEFHQLDEKIAVIARRIPGYLGEEAWTSSASELVSTVYYWKTLESLQELMTDPLHLEAKSKYARWINGYQVTVAKVLRSYGDSGISHPLRRSEHNISTSQD